MTRDDGQFIISQYALNESYRSNRSDVVFGYVILVMLVTWIGYFEAPLSVNQKIVVLSLILTTYNVVEAFTLYFRNRQYFFLNPIVIACVINFLIFQGGITNLLLFQDGEYRIFEYSKQLNGNLQWVVLAMTYACYASLAMWTGYKLRIGGNAMRSFIALLRYDSLTSAQLNIRVIVGLAVVGYGFKIYLLSQGLYGRLADEADKAIGENISFLHSQTRFLRQFSLLPFTLICLLFFKTGSKPFKILFIAVLLLEIFFAFIYGARHPILIVMLVVMVTYYYSTGKIKLKILLPVAIAFYLAFTVVMEFKEFAIYTSDRSVSIFQVVDDYMLFRKQMSVRDKEMIYDNVYENMVGRLSFVRESAIALRYKGNPGLQKDDPDFLRPLLMAPIDIFVPKFIQGRPNAAWGFWFKDKVLHRLSDMHYNVSFSSIGYLNFAGGLFAVIIGFFLYGIVLRATYQLLFHGILGVLIFLVLIGGIALFKTAVPSAIVNYLRALLMYPLLVFILFGRHSYGFIFKPGLWKLGR